jgi:hypothetical protein
MPLSTVHITLVLPLPVTCAVNWTWLEEAPDGATNAYAGEIAIVTEPLLDDVTVTCAQPLVDRSALLVAVSVTGFDTGTVAGAR